MPIVPVQSMPVPETSIVSLPAYARHLQVCECAFYGITGGPECVYSGACGKIWTQDMRDWAAYYLAEAQYELEKFIGYFIGRRWVVDERRDVKSRIMTRWGYVVSGGVKQTDIVADSTVVNHATDPAVIGPVATTATDSQELHLYHEDSDIEIIPSAVLIAGGNVTFEVPRCRMVLPSKANNSEAGLSYSNLTNFASAVDVKWEYNVDNNPASLIYQSCNGVANCTDTSVDACIYVHKSRVGSVSVSIGSVCSGCGALMGVDLNYYAGRPFTDADGNYTDFARQAQDAIIRLAHSKMPQAPCDCSAADEMWKRDRTVITDAFGKSIRGISPFGVMEGAWAAYTFAKSPGMKLYRGATL